METLCHKQLTFESLFSKEVIANFEGGRITSDGGGLLLRELDQRYRVTENAARYLHDPRDSHKVKHVLLTLVRQRLFAIAQGYEYNYDAAALARDPAFKIRICFSRRFTSLILVASSCAASSHANSPGHTVSPDSSLAANCFRYFSIKFNSSGSGGRAHKWLEQQMVGEFLFKNLLSGHRYLLFLRKNRYMVTLESISRQSSFYYVQWQVSYGLILEVEENRPEVQSGSLG
jgi:hypothetical protein